MTVVPFQTWGIFRSSFLADGVPEQHVDQIVEWALQPKYYDESGDPLDDNDVVDDFDLDDLEDMPTDAELEEEFEAAAKFHEQRKTLLAGAADLSAREIYHLMFNEYPAE